MDTLQQLVADGVTVRHHYQVLSDTVQTVTEPFASDSGYSAVRDPVNASHVQAVNLVVCDTDDSQCADIVQWCQSASVPIYLPGDSANSTFTIPTIPAVLDELLSDDPVACSTADVVDATSGVETVVHAAGKPVGKTAANASMGEVFLVGAGPGDPDLLTFRALKLIRRAEVVLYDRLVSPDIVAMCRQGVEKVYVGKQRAEHAMRQELINDTLARYAQQGKKVLRLKGGDPFIFGRGGEEIETLSALGIPFQIVPGITAATGCASYAGIPLTHRDHAQSCVFVTGHLKAGELDLNWAALAQPSQTIVCYMGLVGLPVFCDSLIQHGLQPDTPAALIERGTTSAQGVYTGTLQSLPDLIARHDVTAPTLIMVGSVVSLREKFAWF